MTPVDIPHMTALLRTSSISQAARVLGVSRMTVARRMRQYNIPRKEVDLDRVATLRQSGESVARIAKRLNVSDQTIYNRLKTVV